jgi:hypothetical protein
MSLQDLIRDHKIEVLEYSKNVSTTIYSSMVYCWRLKDIYLLQIREEGYHIHNGSSMAFVLPLAIVTLLMFRCKDTHTHGL